MRVDKIKNCLDTQSQYNFIAQSYNDLMIVKLKIGNNTSIAKQYNYIGSPNYPLYIRYGFIIRCSAWFKYNYNVLYAYIHVYIINIPASESSQNVSQLLLGHLYGRSRSFVSERSLRACFSSLYRQVIISFTGFLVKNTWISSCCNGTLSTCVHACMQNNRVS